MFKPGGPTIRELAKQALSSTKGGYDLLSSKFDKTPFLTTKPIVSEITKYIRSEKASYDNALDLCTGTGAGISAILPLVRKRVIGMDWSEPMLAEARKKFKTHFGGPRVSFVCKNMFDLEYRNALDLITFFGALGHIERYQKKQFIDLVYSMLKPDGVFVFDAFASPSLLSQMFWSFLGFDCVIRARNILLKPPFIMYYSDYLLSGTLPFFNREKWSIRTLKLNVPEKPNAMIVIARKR